MPRSRKCYHPNSLVEICFRAEEGLPLPATPYMRRIVLSVLARAQCMYPVRIVSYVVMGNHMHLKIVVRNPKMVKGFKEYMKRELAHAVNHLLGRDKHTVWCEGCDDTVILDVETAIRRYVYLFTNPQKAHLVERIEQYPHLNSWNAFLAGGSTETAKRICRSSIPELPRRSLSLLEQQHIANELEESGHEEYELIIEPDAWMECFSELHNADPEKIRDEIIERVRRMEEELIEKRTGPVVGEHALRLQDIRTPHTPKKRGCRTICLSALKQLRVRYVAWRRSLEKETAQLYRRWCDGELTVKLPPGMYWPGGQLTMPLQLSVGDVLADY